MLDELKTLVELQLIDSSLNEAGEKLREIPKAQRKLEAEIAAEEETVASQRAAVSAHEKEQRQAELELKSAEEAVKKYEGQLFACKNNKEYEAIKLEIKENREKISSIEEQILVLMDKLEKERQLLGEEEKIFLEKKKDLEEQFASFQRQIEQEQGKQENIRKKRAEIVQRVGKNLQHRYEKIARARRNLAVVGITETACKGCYFQLPPQLVNEVMKNDSIQTCQSCGRILYWEKAD